MAGKDPRRKGARDGPDGVKSRGKSETTPATEARVKIRKKAYDSAARKLCGVRGQVERWSADASNREEKQGKSSGD